MTNILSEIFNKKVLAILKVLINDSSGEGLYLREISKAADVPAATTYRILKKLNDAGIVTKTRVKQIKLYKIRQSEGSALLFKLLRKEARALDRFIELAKQLPAVETIILHGKEEKNRANVLLIGEDIDASHIKKICAMIKEEYDFVIAPLSLTAEQFEQMLKMGLYSSEKKVLFSRSVSAPAGI